MNKERVFDKLNKEYIYVDMDTAKIHNFNNSKKIITYNVKEIGHDYWVDVDVKGILNKVEDKFEAWNNPIKFFYAMTVGFDASHNDPDRKIKQKIIDYVKKHQDKFFTKSGNWRKRIGAEKGELKLLINDK